VVDEAESYRRELGTGERSLIRVISRKGGVRRCPFLPQRPYIPIGSLRHAVKYLGPAESKTTREMADVLHNVGLDHLVERLHVEGSKDQTLSGGEKQRLAFASMFVQGPGYRVPNEATAALDPQSHDRPWAICFEGRLGYRLRLHLVECTQY
jgi:vitamin B12/bleomycin/antimicrobial peptide transport system ATP-binding/permease protein